MNVQVNTKSAAKRIGKFIKAHGGSAQHSEVLELLAEVCGFDCYRAMQAVSEPEIYAGPLIGSIRTQLEQLRQPRMPWRTRSM